MRVSFIRHQRCYNLREDGSPNFNIINPALTERGIKGAQTLIGRYDLIIISPMARCIETYTYSKLEGTREVNHLFREWRQGPADFHHHDLTCTMCETKQQLGERIKRGFEYLRSLKCDNICVITHSEWMKEALNLEHPPDYGEVVIIDI